MTKQNIVESNRKYLEFFVVTGVFPYTAAVYGHSTCAWPCLLPSMSLGQEGSVPANSGIVHCLVKLLFASITWETAR